MKIYLRHVEAYGFKGGDIFSSRFHRLYYRKCPTTKTVTVISNYTPQYVAQFQLTAQEYSAFNRGTLGITPPGCCNAHGRKSIENPSTLIQRDIKDIKDLKAILHALGIFSMDELITTNPHFAKIFAKKKKVKL